MVADHDQAVLAKRAVQKRGIGGFSQLSVDRVKADVTHHSQVYL